MATGAASYSECLIEKKLFNIFAVSVFQSLKDSVRIGEQRSFQLCKPII